MGMTSLVQLLKKMAATPLLRWLWGGYWAHTGKGQGPWRSEVRLAVLVGCLQAATAIVQNLVCLLSSCLELAFCCKVHADLVFSLHSGHTLYH